MTRDQIKAAAAAVPLTAESLTDSYVQQVPDKCDRIVWRNRYYSLPPAPAAVPPADAAELAQWRKLRDPELLHANLIRGLPAQLSREQFLHLAGGAVPPGYALVPIEPTPEMWDAAWESIGLPYRAKLSIHEIRTFFAQFHAAMIAAAGDKP